MVTANWYYSKDIPRNSNSIFWNQVRKFLLVCVEAVEKSQEERVRRMQAYRAYWE